jgi:hypothetical protein
MTQAVSLSDLAVLVTLDGIANILGRAHLPETVLERVTEALVGRR